MNIRKLIEAKAKQLWPHDERSQRYFVALAQQESGFNPRAVPPGNPVDVYGLFQFGPELRKRYGLTPDSTPQEQIDAAGQYLSDLHARHGGDWSRILAEHYLGAPRLARMDRGIQDAETRSFFERHLPAVARFAEAGGNPPEPARETAPTAVAASTPPQPQAPAPPAVDLAALLPQRTQPQMDPRNGLLLSLLAAANPQLSPVLQLLAMRQRSGVS